MLRIGDALAIEGQDVEVDQPRAPSATIRIPAQRQLQALQLAQEVGGLQIGLQLEGGVQEVRLVDAAARRAVVQRGDADDLADPPQLGHRRAEGDGRLTEVSPRPMKARTWPAL